MPAPIPDSVRTEMAATARQAVAYCCRRVRWLDESEVAQEVWAAMLSALPAFDPSLGRPLGAYLYRTAVRAGHQLAWTLGAPTHVPYMSRRSDVLTRHTSARVDSDVLEQAPTDDGNGEQALSAKERRERVAAVVARHLADDQEGRAVLAVLCGDMRSSEAAKAFQVDVTRLYQATRAAKDALRSDRRLMEVL